MSRLSTIERNTKETQIRLELNLDGAGRAQVQSTIPFLDHMLELFARHGFLDISLQARGDTHVDLHHTTEDVGLVLGQALREALGDKAGIRRYGHITLPMDEALVECAIDLSGRPWFSLKMADEKFLAQEIPQKRGELEGLGLQDVAEFFRGLANQAGMTLHLEERRGENLHHIMEAMFKAVGRALAEAVATDPRLAGQIPSTKGKL